MLPILPVCLFSLLVNIHILEGDLQDLNQMMKKYPSQGYEQPE